MKDLKLQFPKGFLFGTATSAYQIEGAWNEDGKGESIWDRYCHDGMGKVANNDTADISIDHYHHLDEDLDMLKDIGCKTYRFSLAWTRLLPNGIGEVNQKGIDFYNKLIDGLLARDIIPAVTLYHWDLPAALQDMGGWTNREIVNWFLEYAELCFKSFGDRVKLWMTHNEMTVFTFSGYSTGKFPPCIRDYKMAVLAAHHALLAHGAAVKLYRDMGLDGKIGVALDLVPKVPLTDAEEDIKVAEIANATSHFLFYDAIVKGCYSELALKIYRENNFLPNFDFEVMAEDMKIISEKCDFIGVNYYYTQAVRYKKGEGRFDYEVAFRNLNRSTADWEIDPEGFYDLLMKIKRDTNGSMPIIITENGYSADEVRTFEEEIMDYDRIDYLEKHLTALHRAISDGVDVRGYMLWSAFDNFEWNFGFEKRFGLIYVDYKTLKRTKKLSAEWYRRLIEYQKNVK